MMPGIRLYLKQSATNYSLVEAHHYEKLRDRLDKNEKGWIELDSVYPGEKVFIRLEDISDLALMTSAGIAIRDEEEVEDRIKNAS